MLYAIELYLCNVLASSVTHRINIMSNCHIVSHNILLLASLITIQIMRVQRFSVLCISLYATISLYFTHGQSPLIHHQVINAQLVLPSCN